MNEKEDKNIVKLHTLPYGLEEINLIYGKPYIGNDMTEYNSEFRENMLKLFELPYKLRLSWDKEISVSRILAHKKVGNSIIDALVEVKNKLGYEYMVEHELDLFGGVFNFRTVRGNDKKLSTHSWGIAIDLCPHIGYQGADPNNFPKEYVEAFKSRGWIWGGDWEHTDPMHFQSCRGY